MHTEQTITYVLNEHEFTDDDKSLYSRLSRD